MQSVSTKRFNLVPPIAALAIALSVAVGIAFVAFDGSNTVPSQSRPVTREADIHEIIVRDTGGPWVRSSDLNNVRPTVTGTRAAGQGEGRLEMRTVHVPAAPSLSYEEILWLEHNGVAGDTSGGTLPADTGNRPALPLSKSDD